MSKYKPSISDKRLPIDTGYVSKLLNDVLGVESSAYVTYLKERDYKAMPYPDVKQKTKNNGGTPAYHIKTKNTENDYDNAPSRFGIKTWGAFRFKGSEKGYKKYDTKGELTPVSISDFLMPLASSVSFSRAKKLTEYNDIIEMSKMSKWAIRIQGIIIPDEHNPSGQQTVAEQMEMIQQYHEIAGSIDVEGQLFDEHDITRIVTTDLSFDPVQNHPQMMKYKLTAKSDVDFLLTETL